MLGLNMTILISGWSSSKARAVLSTKLFTAGEYLPLDIWNSGSGQFSISSLIGDSFSLEFVEPAKKNGEEKRVIDILVLQKYEVIEGKVRYK